MSSAKGIVLAEDAPLPEKKRKFSFFRGRNTEPIVTVIPVEGPSSPQTPTPLTSPTHTQASGSGWQAGSVRSSSSFLGDISSAQRAPSLSQALEDPDLLSKADVDGLPTYASVGYPPVAVTYSFVRCSPFAMMLCPEGSSTEGSGLYHISVGVNVWMPSMTVTTVRRGSGETGPIIASLELGISSSPATVTVGEVCQPLDQVFYRKSTMSSTRTYFIGPGRGIKWKMGPNSWQAHYGTTPLATFLPTPPRKLTVEPVGHRLLDCLMVSLIILMREHLTPLAGMQGDSAQLFNYSPHYNYRED